MERFIAAFVIISFIISFIFKIQYGEIYSTESNIYNRLYEYLKSSMERFIEQTFTVKSMHG